MQKFGKKKKNILQESIGYIEFKIQNIVYFVIILNCALYYILYISKFYNKLRYICAYFSFESLL